MNEHRFYREVAEALRCDEQRAASIVYVVFQELRARITPKEAADVAAQLPVGLKKLWLEDETRERAVRRTHLDDFLGRVRQRGSLGDEREAERSTSAVFGALQAMLGSATGTEGEAWHIFSQLPKGLKLLWLESSKRQLPRLGNGSGT